MDCIYEGKNIMNVVIYIWFPTKIYNWTVNVVDAVLMVYYQIDLGQNLAPILWPQLQWCIL